jgi:hypothetical protein
VVFLGDYFDCFEHVDNERYFSVRYVCGWLNDKRKELGDKATWLLGNHDLAYVATHLPNSFSIDHQGRPYLCSGWTKNKASTFNQYIDPEFVKGLELCVDIGSFVCSHAGFNYQQFNGEGSERQNIEKLYNEWEEDKENFILTPFHWIINVGPCRGGVADIGSPVWLDWNMEFVSLEDVRQIVGHTNGQDVREKDIGGKKDYCIDAYRTTVAIVEGEEIRFEYV